MMNIMSNNPVHITSKLRYNRTLNFFLYKMALKQNEKFIF